MRPANFIYGLIDPRTLLIRYVGLTSVGMRRPRAHLKTLRHGSRTYCKNWIAKLQLLGLTYDIAVLEILDDPVELDQAERWWIAFGRACGWPLTNHTDGGSVEEATRIEQRRQKALEKERRAEDAVAREQRKIEDAAKEETAKTARRLNLYSMISKRHGVSIEELEQEYQAHTEWKRAVEGRATEKRLERLERARQSLSRVRQGSRK